MNINKEAAIKILKDIELNDTMDNMFTEALISLENKEYEKAYEYAEYIADNSKVVEQRCAAITLTLIASQANDKATKTFLDKIYNY